MPNFGKSDAHVHTDISPTELDGMILSELLKRKGIAKASLVGNSKGPGATPSTSRCTTTTSSICWC